MSPRILRQHSPDAFNPNRMRSILLIRYLIIRLIHERIVSYLSASYIYEMFKTIITLLNGDRETTSNRQSTATDVNDESSTKEIKIPQKFKADVETLMKLYPSAFEDKHGIVMTLKEAIGIIPRDRVRTDSYKALQEWLLVNMGVKLSVRSQKYHDTVYKKLEKGFRDDPLLE